MRDRVDSVRRLQSVDHGVMTESMHWRCTHGGSDSSPTQRVGLERREAVASLVAVPLDHGISPYDELDPIGHGAEVINLLCHGALEQEPSAGEEE